MAICLSEGEKDSATLAGAGLIAFSGPRGAQSLPGADFTELAQVAKETGLPVLLIGDNDKPGLEAMRKVRSLLKSDSHLDVSDLTGLAPEGGSLADLPIADLQALLRIKLSDRDPTWQKPGRNRAQYVKFNCPRPIAKYQECRRRRRNMGPGAVRECRHLQAVWRMGILPAHRAVLARQASSNGEDIGLRWG